jgi:predicted nucleotidyltransferase component of viral defense system
MMKDVKKNMNGFSNNFSKQLDALKILCSEVLSKIPLHIWSFGGGTALSLFYFQHRRSYDIDIFINDPQYFPFLSPKWFIDESSDFEPDYHELAHHISLKTVTGIKTDIFLSPRMTHDRPILKQFSDIACYVDSVSEIIAKKLRCRISTMRVRDIFDIAVAVQKKPTILKDLWNDKVITADELFEWQSRLKKTDSAIYLERIKITAPYPEYRELSAEAPQRIVQNIEQVKAEICRELG